MIGSTENGGMKMPCSRTMVKTQKVMWVQRILSSKMGKCKELALKLMSLDKDDCVGTRLVSHLDASLHFTPRYLNSGLNFIQWNLLRNIFGTIGLLK